MNVRCSLNPSLLLTNLFLTCFLVASAASQNAAVRILPLGDSITKGVSGPSTDDAGYRNDLDSLLTAEGVAFDFVGVFSDGEGFDADHAGHDGFRADRLLPVVHSVLSATTPDVVLLHIGTNDVSGTQEPAGIRDEIAAILDEIQAFNPDIRILLASLIPRADQKDEKNSRLNELLMGLFLAKRDAGFNIFYVGMNEILKLNPDWATDYFAPEDPVHPNDLGFNIMAQVWFEAVMTAITKDVDALVTDNFERSHLGITWDNDPELKLKEGDLVNTATSGSSRWEYMATYRAVRNPTRVGVRWSENASRSGIGRGGLALLLDAPHREANGYLAWINTRDNTLRLWTVTNGQAAEDLHLRQPSATSKPRPGSWFAVEIVGSVDSLRFDYYVNDALAGSVTVPNPRQDVWYSGILLRHKRNNQVADFFAEGRGDFDPPAPVEDLAVIASSATSALLRWTAPGDDGHQGRADHYDLRYAVGDIVTEEDFQAATPVPHVPRPARAGTEETLAELDLQPGTPYAFALRVFDDAGNASPLSNVVTLTTEPGELYTDDFERSELGSDWQADSVFSIVEGELANTSANQERWNLAVYTAQANPVEASFRWSPSADTVGIDQGGLAVLLDAPDPTANGYLITRRTLKNQIRLWRIRGGQNPAEPIIETPLLARPSPGDEFRVRLASDSTGNHFTVFINGREDITLTDPDFFIDPRSKPAFYAGVMLAGGRNNRIDRFKILVTGVPVAVGDPPAAAPPTDFVLSQNYPNPFNPSTRVDYALPVASDVTIAVFNLRGQHVRTLRQGRQAAGRYTLTWDGTTDRGLPVVSGLYLLRLRAGNTVLTRRMTLVR